VLFRLRPWGWARSPGTNFAVQSDNEVDVTIESNTPIGSYTVQIGTDDDGTVTGSQTFSINGDSTPSISGISPSPLVAGATYPSSTNPIFTITGSGFGTTGTSTDVSFSCDSPPCIDGFNLASWSDTSITGTLTVDENAGGQNVTIAVNSTGYNGLNFQAGPGQSSQGTAQVQVYYCADAQQNQIAAQYPVPDSTTGMAFVPLCIWFTQTASSLYYSATQQGNFGKQPFGWALVKNPLTTPAYTFYGLDFWTYLMGAGAQTIDSTYRPPVYNQQKGGQPDSRHQFGDAVDIHNVSGTQLEHDLKACLASVAAASSSSGGRVMTSCAYLGVTIDASADWVESTTGACGMSCVHADWRSHDYEVYSQ